MNITKETIKSALRNIMTEESEYQTFFKKALEKAGKSIPSMSDEEKKEFFNKIDAAWNAKGEKNEALVGNQHKLDVDGDGEIEASDLAALRAGEKADEEVNEEKYPIAVEKFNKELIKHPMVKKAAEFYKKTPAEIVKAIQQRLYSKGDKSGNTKEVWIDFKDTTSGITIKHKMKFNESAGCGCGCGCGGSKMNEGFYKSIVNDGGRNLFFAMIDDKTDAVKTIDAKTWLSSSLMDNASKESKERVVKAILKNEKQFNKKVEFNMWAKKNNPKFAEIMDYFFKNNFIGNITAKGIKVYEGVESVNEGRAFINAAKKAKAEGKTEFEFNGKTYPVTIKESVTEGKKVFKVNPAIGKVKYSISSHDGVKKHKDGSDFFDIETFKNKVDLEKAIKNYTSKGFQMESVVNEDANMNKKVKAFLDKGLNDLSKGKPNHQFAVMHILMGALTDANFHSESKKVPSIFSRAKYEGDPMGKKDAIGIYEEMGENIASICKWDGKDIVDAIGFYVSMTIGRPVGEKVEKLVESVNETIYLLNNKK